MPMLNFKKQFAAAVEDGSKRRTMRRPRKDGRDPQAGQTLHLYTGARTKVCRPLGTAVCTKVRAVTILALGIVMDGQALEAGSGTTLGTCADPDRYDVDFARADGFKDFYEMAEFFKAEYGLPVDLKLIEWGKVSA